MIKGTAEVIKDFVQMAAIAGGLYWGINSMKPTCVDEVNFKGNRISLYQTKNLVPGQMCRQGDYKTDIRFADGAEVSYNCRLAPAQIARALKESEHSRAGN